MGKKAWEKYTTHMHLLSSPGGQKAPNHVDCKISQICCFSSSGTTYEPMSSDWCCASITLFFCLSLNQYLSVQLHSLQLSLIELSFSLIIPNPTKLSFTTSAASKGYKTRVVHHKNLWISCVSLFLFPKFSTWNENLVKGFLMLKVLPALWYFLTPSLPLCLQLP
jgi:hypothetical protein